MKKLKLNQMENLNGGTSGRGCLLLGAAMMLAIPFSAGFAIGLFGGAAAGDCF